MNVICPNGHQTQKINADQWRRQRDCAICGAITLVVYGDCPHHSWRYPHAYPLDGQHCERVFLEGELHEGCGARFVAPFLPFEEKTLEQLRGLGEIRSELYLKDVLVQRARESGQNASGITRRANRVIEDLVYTHGFCDV